MRTHRPSTLFTRAVFLVGLLGFGISVATDSQAGNQLFVGSWSVKAQGNECLEADPSPGPICAGGWGGNQDAFYSAIGIPLGVQCNPIQPRCPFQSTPTDGMGKFHPLGKSASPTMMSNSTTAINCANLSTYAGGIGGTMRPAKGGTASHVPPLYRNPNFFTGGGQPKTTSCNARSTGVFTSTQTRFGADKGFVQKGNPVTGKWVASTTGTGMGGFNFAAAGINGAGIRVTGRVGDFPVPGSRYLYTYATLRNDAGVFGPGKGPGNFYLDYFDSGTAVQIHVKQGAAKFGGTMRMLGALTAKTFNSQSSYGFGFNNWRYEAIGATAMTMTNAVTGGYIASWAGTYYNTSLTQTNMFNLYGARFPWTTGDVRIHAYTIYCCLSIIYNLKAYHVAHGYDNRNTTGRGTIQLVTPLVTTYRANSLSASRSVGIGILKIKFVPEPQAWAMLVAGVPLLGVGYRMRGH